MLTHDIDEFIELTNINFHERCSLFAFYNFIVRVILWDFILSSATIN